MRPGADEPRSPSEPGQRALDWLVSPTPGREKGTQGPAESPPRARRRGAPDQRTDRWSSLPASPAACPGGGSPGRSSQRPWAAVPAPRGPGRTQASPLPPLSPLPPPPTSLPLRWPLDPGIWPRPPAARSSLPHPASWAAPQWGAGASLSRPSPATSTHPGPLAPRPALPAQGRPSSPRLPASPPQPLLRRLPPPPTTRGSGIPGGTYSPGRPYPRRAKAREVCCPGAVAPRGKWLVAVVAVSRPS